MSILEEAMKTIEARGHDYGNPFDMCKQIASMWNILLKLDNVITPKDVCVMMAALKLCREMNTHKLDNLVDIAGYAAIAEKVVKEGEKSPLNMSSQEIARAANKMFFAE